MPAAGTRDDLVYARATPTDRRIVSFDRSGNERPVSFGLGGGRTTSIFADGTKLDQIWDGGMRAIWTIPSLRGR
jgi:hypothetical protein